MMRLFRLNFGCAQFKYFNLVRTTAGQEDPFELDSNLLLSSGRHGEDRKRQYNLFYTTMKHRYLTIWLTYCISIASLQY